MKFLTAFIILVKITVLSAVAQHEQELDHPYWRISPFIGHTFVALEKGGEHTPISSWALDVEYWWKEHVGIGLHNDLEIASFIVESETDEFIERSFPCVVSFDFLIKPVGNVVLYAGPGIEFDANENFSLIRLGIEYEFLLNKHFDFAPAFFYDNRNNAFNTWTIAFGVGWRP
ncbi:MAG: hypothetical protein AAGA66_12670 [Bacteroidota bacterium]